MFIDINRVRVFIKPGRTDFRKAVNGLSMVVEETMKLDPFSGNIFVFCNRRRDRLKILYWDRNGFCLWYKRLEEEKFLWPRTGDDVQEITGEELGWLLRGLDIRGAHRSLRYASVI